MRGDQTRQWHAGTSEPLLFHPYQRRDLAGKEEVIAEWYTRAMHRHEKHCHYFLLHDIAFITHVQTFARSSQVIDYSIPVLCNMTSDPKSSLFIGIKIREQQDSG